MFYQQLDCALAMLLVDSTKIHRVAYGGHVRFKKK